MDYEIQQRKKNENQPQELEGAIQAINLQMTGQARAMKHLKKGRCKMENNFNSEGKTGKCNETKCRFLNTFNWLLRLTEVL